MKLNNLIKEEINKYIETIICESQESKSQNKAIRLAIENGMDIERAKEFVRIDLRNDLTELRDLNTAKFTLGCARLFFERQLTDAKSISLLNAILKLITERYYDKFDQNLNDLSLSDLSNQFTQELNTIEQKNRDEVNSKEYHNNGYDIVPINSFEDAKKYDKYTDFGKKYHWCITYMKGMWDSYTKDGDNQVYFCLKDGFENMTPLEETGNPKDKYGLSMISVIVNEDGNLAYSTTRWNHANGANGSNDLTVQEISDIVGVNFYETFKPNDSFNKHVLNAISRLNDGEDINKIFLCSYRSSNYNIYLVRLGDKWNFVGENRKILSKQWFDYAYDFKNGFSIVKQGHKFNFVDTNCNLLSDQWFDDARCFNENGFSIIELNNKLYYIDTSGNLYDIE